MKIYYEYMPKSDRAELCGRSISSIFEEPPHTHTDFLVATQICTPTGRE